MAEDDERDPKPETTDPDRAAILARRQQFVALALSGLATTACTDGHNKSRRGSQGDSKGQIAPQPCLKEEIREREHEEAPPQPCLSVAPPEPPPEPPPQPCLKVAAPEPDETGGQSEDGDESRPKPEAKPEPAPRPCLKKAAPRPCLRKKAPE